MVGKSTPQVMTDAEQQRKHDADAFADAFADPQKFLSMFVDGGSSKPATSRLPQANITSPTRPSPSNHYQQFMSNGQMVSPTTNGKGLRPSNSLHQANPQLPSRGSNYLSHANSPPREIPAHGWQYVDPKGNVQGPFSLQEMQQWSSMGYFKPALFMRCDPNDRFMPLCQMYPDTAVAFHSYPNRKPGPPM